MATVSYYHAVIKHQMITVPGQTYDNNVTGHTLDFLTGDMGRHALRDEVLVIADNNTRGTTLSRTAASGATLLRVASLTDMDSNKLAVKLDSGVHHWVKVVQFNSAERLIEIEPALPFAADSGNQVVSTTQLNSSTAFTTATDFKTHKLQVIEGNSYQLLHNSLYYERHTFAITTDLITRALLLKDGILNGLMSASDKHLPDSEGEYYLFASDEEFAAWFNLLRNLYTSIMTGERRLRISINAAPNTAAAMDAIHDTRD